MLIGKYFNGYDNTTYVLKGGMSGTATWETMSNPIPTA
jgi:hypothetical protein